MKAEVAHSCCPLCKRKLPEHSTGEILDTRLCERCQSLAVTAFRGPMAAASTAVVAIDDVVAQVQAEVRAPDYSVADFPGFDDFSTGAQPSEVEVQHPMPFNPNEETVFAFFGQEEPDYTAHRGEVDLPSLSKNESALDELDAGPFQSSSVQEYAPDQLAEPDNSPQTEDLCAIAETQLSERSSFISGQYEEQTPIEEAAGVTDPWDDPLPAWDYSQSEWPVLAGTSRQRSFTRLQVLIAAIVLLVCAAGFYFLIYRSSTPEGAAASTDVVAGASLAETQRSGEPEQPSTASVQREAAVSQPTDTVAANESVTAPGQFSLQAAAFATQGGADEFAEKLKQAGVPSFVAPADIARRGRWFRVRVGRFNSAEEAQRFAGEAQLRARAAGLAVQLIVCQDK